MNKVMASSKLSIRRHAESFLVECGFSGPPLRPDEALAARKLKVAQLSLDDLLVKANLPPTDSRKIQAMLDVRNRAIHFKSDLPNQKRRWGALHEVGHEYIPWQREFLYCCPLIWLPHHIQKQFEAEADIFAAEAFFFGGQFTELAFDGEIALNTAIELANDVYQTSIHATLAHYVQESPTPICLLVWEPKAGDNSSPPSEQLELHYYVKSKSFRGHISPGQIADPDGAIYKAYEDPKIGVVSHEVTHISVSGEKIIAQAESFSNSYNVLTLMSQPVRKISTVT